jgi:hypothetical protein
MKCSGCQRLITQEKIGFRDECPHCGKDLHICLHCFFYDPSAYRQCRETVPEAVTDKERANFCEYFRPGRESPARDNGARTAKGKLEDLFKKK